MAVLFYSPISDGFFLWMLNEWGG